VAIVVAGAVLTALGPLPPGLVLSQDWRLALALALGLTTVVAHWLLQRMGRPAGDDDPLPAVRAVLATAALLVTGSVRRGVTWSTGGHRSTTPARSRWAHGPEGSASRPQAVHAPGHGARPGIRDAIAAG
jgi:hypothetical protein